MSCPNSPLCIWRASLSSARCRPHSDSLLDAKRLNLGLTVFVIIRTSQHDDIWLQKFARTVKEMPEITAIWRMAGDIDYLLRVVVKDMEAYDSFYKRLIKRVSLSDVSSTCVIEEIKYSTTVPLDALPPATVLPTERGLN